MADGSTIKLPHLEAYPVHVSLFRDVKNATFLRQQLLEGNTDFEYAFLDATTITSVNHVLAAVFRAINDLLQNRLKSRNVHSEIVFSLSPNNNIAESFRRFGIADSTTNLLAIKVSNVPNAIPTQLDPANHLSDSVEGTRIEFNDDNIQTVADVARVRKIYKLNSGSNTAGSKSKASKVGNTGPDAKQINGAHNDVDDFKEIEAVVLGIMALKGS